MEKQNTPKPIDLIALLPRLFKQFKRLWLLVLALMVLLLNMKVKVMANAMVIQLIYQN